MHTYPFHQNMHPTAETCSSKNRDKEESGNTLVMENRVNCMKTASALHTMTEQRGRRGERGGKLWQRQE